MAFRWEEILGTAVTASTTPFYLPAFMVLVAALLTVGLHRMRGREFLAAFSESSRTLLGAGFVLIFTVPMVRIYINSDVNALGIDSMPIVMADWVAVNVGAVWPFFAPFIGALGAFIAGSNTVSNLMFALLQHGVATALGNFSRAGGGLAGGGRRGGQHDRNPQRGGGFGHGGLCWARRAPRCAAR